MEKLCCYGKYYGTMVKSYGTIEKKMWYYTENYETLIYYGKIMVLWKKLSYYSKL